MHFDFKRYTFLSVFIAISLFLVSCDSDTSLKGLMSFRDSPYGLSLRIPNIEKQNNQDSTLKQKLNIDDFQSYIDEVGQDRLEQIRTLIQDATIKETINLFTSKKLSVEELVIFYISRIKKYQNYNSVITINPKIIQLAREKDIILNSSNNLGIMFGIPVLIKDNIATKNMHTTAGAAAFKDLTINLDAPVIQNIKKRGALILGKANLSELSGFMSSSAPTGYSAIGGHTKNAYGKFDVGGSSSGPAASVALGLSSVAIGTETSGSMIYPSGQNSVFGLKPSRDALDNSLIFPIFEKNDTPGAIARNAQDLKTLYLAMADRASDDIQKFFSNGTTNKPKMGFLSSKVFDEDSKLFNNLINKLKQNGVDTKPIKDLIPPQISQLTGFLVNGMKVDFTNFLGKIKNSSNLSIDTLEEFVQFTKQDKQRALYGYDLLEYVLAFDKQGFGKSEFSNFSSVARDNMDLMFETNEIDFIITSSNLFSMQYMVAGSPAMTIPVGYRDNKEPVGVTIIARKGEDLKLLWLAELISEFFNKRVNLLKK